MDIADLNKVANRKRINVEADKLREKVSRETAKIIKLKVAQDTAYWDLKEKLHQLEGNHERLQQNMLDVQMQHETLSGKYQDELRLRPETLNKLNSTREICDVLEDYSERLKETLSRCKSDQATLCEAYQKSGQFVKDLKMKQAADDDRARTTIAGLEERVKQSSEHQHQLVQLFSATKQQLDDELKEVKNKLNTAQTQREEQLKITNDMARDLDAKKFELHACEKKIASLQNDMKRLILEFNTEVATMNATIAKQEKEIKDSAETIETLKKALANQEEFTKSVCDQNTGLQNNISALEQENSERKNEVEALTKQLQEMTVTGDSLRQDLTSLVAAKENLEKLIEDKNLQLFNAATDKENLKLEVANLMQEKSSLQDTIASLTEESHSKTALIEELKATVKDNEDKIQDLEKNMAEFQITQEERTNELNLQLEKKQSEATSKGETINRLMNDIKMCMDIRSRLELNLEKGKKEMENEKEKAAEREKGLMRQIEQLEKASRDKEEELNRQMSIILEMRSEKEKLQLKISSMQGTIDNIQKELTVDRGAVPRNNCMPPPELDDHNANMSPLRQPAPCPSKSTKFVRPSAREHKQADSMLFSIFSDSSMDGDALDPSEVNRRFESLSRGERIPPITLSTLKRQRAATPIKMKPISKKTPVSLSQFREEKEKTFFKTKRPGENKIKRQKKIDEPEKS